MGVRSIIRKALGAREGESQPPRLSPAPKRRSELDMYFTAQFQAKARQWGLTEDHARYVFWEGDPVPGKENLKVVMYKGEEIGIYVFRDEKTNQPVITSIWKRQLRTR